MRTKEQFHFMYTHYSWRKGMRDYTHRAIYKHWNNWCFKCSHGLYCFDKGYDDEYKKFEMDKSGLEWMK